MTATAPSSTLLSSLATAYANAAQSRTQIELDIIKGRIQQQTNKKIAALQGPVDTVHIQTTQSQIKQLTAQYNATNQIAGQFSANSNVISDLMAQFSSLQTAISNGDSANFDRILGYATGGLGTMYVIPPTPPYQPSDIEQFKTNGLGIKSAATYDLSTAAGQAAAAADVQNAQQAALQISAIMTNNQLVAYDQSAAQATQINSLNKSLTQMQNENSDYISAQTSKLRQQAQIQQHLIQLGLGNSTTLGNALQTATTSSDVSKSPFDGLGYKSSPSATNGANPAVLSLLV